MKDGLPGRQHQPIGEVKRQKSKVKSQRGEQRAEQPRGLRFEQLPVELPEKRAVQREIQVKVKVKVEVKTQPTMRPPTQVAIRLTTTPPILPDEQQRMLSWGPIAPSARGASETGWRRPKSLLGATAGRLRRRYHDAVESPAGGGSPVRAPSRDSGIPSGSCAPQSAIFNRESTMELGRAGGAVGHLGGRTNPVPYDSGEWAVQDSNLRPPD